MENGRSEERANTDEVGIKKYEPTDYERRVLEKQAQRLKDQVRAPCIKFVEDERGGRLEFDHPNQTIAFAMLKEAFGTADDRSAHGLLDYLCMVLPTNDNSAFGYPNESDLNCAISLIASGKAVDEFHAAILADLAACRSTLARLLHNLSEPVRFDLSEELKLALEHYKYDPKERTDRGIKIDNRPVLEFSIRSATRLMTLCVELIAAANRHRAIVESSRVVQQLSVEPTLNEIEAASANAGRKRATAARVRRLNGTAVAKPAQRANSTRGQQDNGQAQT